MKLHTLSPGKGARRPAQRVGRGNGSGWGKTAGRGHRGLGCRSGGKVRPGFEGGQMPLYRRIPKFGFVSRKQVLGLNQYSVVNLSVLERFDAGATVDRAALKAVGYGGKASCRGGIKVLAGGDLSKQLHVKVAAVSAAARAKIEAAGGTVEIVKE